MSFSREPVSDPCRDSQDTIQDNNIQQNEMNESAMVLSNERDFSHVFNSQEFSKFLSRELPKYHLDSGNAFLSKDLSLPGIDSSLFKSKDSFSNLYSGKDWELNYSQEDLNQFSEGAQFPKKIEFIPTTVTMPARTGNKEVPSPVLSSKDWMPFNTLGSHIDVNYDSEMFNGSDQDDGVEEFPTEVAQPQTQTDWDSLFYSQLQLFPPPSPSISEDRAASTSSVPVAPQQTIVVEPRTEALLPELQPSCEVAFGGAAIDAPKKKRKRRPRKKIVPEVKEYVEPKDFDVLLGRGGRSNHHPGNKRYREEVKNLQSWYLEVDDKNEKTDLSQCLVEYVHSYNGRFLQKDECGWYVVPNIIARRKASQALREDNDAEKRRAKRQRFLQKKALLEGQSG